MHSCPPSVFNCKNNNTTTSASLDDEVKNFTLRKRLHFYYLKSPKLFVLFVVIAVVVVNVAIWIGLIKLNRMLFHRHMCLPSGECFDLDDATMNGGTAVVIVPSLRRERDGEKEDDKNDEIYDFDVIGDELIYKIGREPATNNNHNKSNDDIERKVGKLKDTKGGSTIAIVVAIRGGKIDEFTFGYSLMKSLTALAGNHSEEATKSPNSNRLNAKHMRIIWSISDSGIVLHNSKNNNNQKQKEEFFFRNLRNFLRINKLAPNINSDEAGAVETLLFKSSTVIFCPTSASSCTLSQLYQNALENLQLVQHHESLHSEQNIKHNNNSHNSKIIMKKEKVEIDTLLFLSDSVLPIDPSSFLKNLIHEYQFEQQKSEKILLGLQCGLAQHPEVFYDSKDNFDRFIRADDANNIETETQERHAGKLHQKIFTNQDVKIVDSGWNVGIAANLYNDYSTNTMATLYSQNHGFSLHSGGFFLSNNNINPKIDLVDALGSHCFIVDWVSLEKAQGFVPSSLSTKSLIDDAVIQSSFAARKSHHGKNKNSIERQTQHQLAKIQFIDAYRRWFLFHSVVNSWRVPEQITTTAPTAKSATITNNNAKNNTSSNISNTTASAKPDDSDKDDDDADDDDDDFNKFLNNDIDGIQKSETLSCLMTPANVGRTAEVAGNVIFEPEMSARLRQKIRKRIKKNELLGLGRLLENHEAVFEEVLRESESAVRLRMTSDDVALWRQTWRKPFYDDLEMNKFRRCERIGFGNTRRRRRSEQRKNQSSVIKNRKVLDLELEVEDDAGDYKFNSIFELLHFPPSESHMKEVSTRIIRASDIHAQAMCYCNLTAEYMQKLRSQRHEFEQDILAASEKIMKQLNSEKTNDDESLKRKQKNNENHQAEKIVVPDSALGWSLSLRLRLLASSRQQSSRGKESRRILGVVKNAPALFVLPKSLSTTTIHHDSRKNEILTNNIKFVTSANFLSELILRPSFRLTNLFPTVATKRKSVHSSNNTNNNYKNIDVSALHQNHHLHNHESSEILFDPAWHKFALSLFPSYAKTIANHQRLQPKTLVDGVLVKHEERKKMAAYVSSIVSNMKHLFRKNILRQQSASELLIQKHHQHWESDVLHANDNDNMNNNINNRSDDDDQSLVIPFVKIYWSQICGGCSGFAAEIAHLVRPLSEIYPVFVGEPAECFCPGHESSFADSLGRSYQNSDKFVFSHLYPHEKIIAIRHTGPRDYKTLLEFSKDMRKPDYVIGRSMYEFTRTADDWKKNVLLADEFWPPSEFCKQIILDNMAPGANTVFVIPEGIDTKFFDPVVHQVGIRPRSLPLEKKKKNQKRRKQNEKHNDADDHDDDDIIEDEKNYFNKKYNVDWNYVICNRPPINESEIQEERLSEMKKSDGKVFFSQFKWEPRKGWRTLFESYFRQFSSLDLRKNKMKDATRSETLPRFLRHPKRRKSSPSASRNRNISSGGNNVDDLYDKFPNHPRNRGHAVEDVTLMILSTISNPDRFYTSNFNSINRRNVSAFIMHELELVMADLLKEYSSPLSSSSSSSVFEHGSVTSKNLQDLLKSEDIPRFCVVGDAVSERELAQLFRGADAFVLPTRGEGWGLPTMQAMAMGLPVISTNWGGSVDFTTQETSFLIELEGLDEVDKWTPYEYMAGKKYATPSVTHLGELMLHVYLNRRGDARSVGDAARRHIVKHFDDSVVAKIVAKRVDEIALEMAVTAVEL